MMLMSIHVVRVIRLAHVAQKLNYRYDQSHEFSYHPVIMVVMKLKRVSKSR